MNPNNTDTKDIGFFKNLFEQNNYNINSCTDELKRRYANVTYTKDFAGVKGAKMKDGTSTQMRNLGNTSYQAKRFAEALRFYNNSISSACPNSLELAQAYSNRAKVLYVKKYYNECLKDIERAQAVDIYPEESKKGLEDLKQKSTKKLKQAKTVQYHVPTPPINNPSPTNPAVADCIEGRETEEWGRHVVATRDIKPGEVLLAEDPYAQTVNHDKTWTHCSECTVLCFNMIHCDTCFVVMYCSEACKEKAYNAYHKYECELIQQDVTIPRHLFIKMSLKAITEKAINDSNDFSEEFKKIADIKVVNDHSQVNVNARKLISDICDWLVSKTDIVKDIKLDKKEAAIYLKTLMFKNCLVCCNNIFEILSYNPELLIFTCIGKGFYTFFSKFNHSCIGNVSYSYFGKKIVVRAMRKINKGEQCFVNYDRINPYKVELKLCQKALQDAFKFTCKCKACVEDWPVGAKLKLIKSQDLDIQECKGKIILASRVAMEYQKEGNTLGKILGEVGGGENLNIPLKEESTGQIHPALRQILLEDSLEAAEKLKDFQPCEEFYFLDHIFDQLLLRGNTDVEL